MASAMSRCTLRRRRVSRRSSQRRVPCRISTVNEVVKRLKKETDLPIVLHTHKHTGVQAGGSQTGTPV